MPWDKLLKPPLEAVHLVTVLKDMVLSFLDHSHSSLSQRQRASPPPDMGSRRTFDLNMLESEVGGGGGWHPSFQGQPASQ